MRASLIITAVVLSAIATVATTSQPLRAQEQGKQTRQMKTTSLLKTALTGVESKEVNILHLNVPPGLVTPKHIHPGQLFVYVVNGAVTIDIDGAAPIKLGPGDVIQEPAGRPMVGKNLSSTHGAELIVFQIGEKGKPLSIDVE